MNASTVTPEPGPPPAQGECRVSERLPCDVPASCQPPSGWKRGGPEWPARLRDVSAGGLCLLLKRRFERGAGLAIEVPATDGGSPSTLLARVVHVRADGAGSWALGCSFVSPLGDEELLALVGATAREPAAPSGRPFIADVDFRGALPQGGVVERRIRKLYVKKPWPLAPGRMIGLRFQAFSGGPIVRVRVDACRSLGGRRILECTFVDPAPANLVGPPPAPPPETRRK